MKKPIRIIICVLTVLIILFVAVFFLYDSPAKYVTKPDGSIYLDKNGEPRLYYTDLFGNKFYQDNGKREYAAVPEWIDDKPESLSVVGS